MNVKLCFTKSWYVQYYNNCTVECQMLVQRGGTFNILLLYILCQTVVRRRGVVSSIFQLLNFKRWYEEVVSSIFHHCQFQEIVSHVTWICKFIHLTAVADEMRWQNQSMAHHYWWLTTHLTWHHNPLQEMIYKKDTYATNVWHNYKWWSTKKHWSSIYIY